MIWPATEIVTFQLKMIAIAKSHKKHENLQKKRNERQTIADGGGCPTGQRPKAC